jgi:YhhN family
MPTWTRMGSSLTLVTTGWLWCTSAPAGLARVFTILVATGMTLGCIGDFFMAGLVIADREASTLGGIASFGLGHCAYIAGVLAFGNGAGLRAPGVRWASWLAWIVVGIAGWYVLVFAPASEPTVLHWAALPYALLLASTAGFATGLAVQERAFVPLAIGAALFLLSDLILAAQLFAKAHFRMINDVVWLMYGPGQMLIVYSSAAAIRLAVERTGQPPTVSLVVNKDMTHDYSS